MNKEVRYKIIRNENKKSMMKIYICPGCGRISMVSRRKTVECMKCQTKMSLTSLELSKFSNMSEKEREDYAEGWLYIHRCKRNA